MHIRICCRVAACLSVTTLPCCCSSCKDSNSMAAQACSCNPHRTLRDARGELTGCELPWHMQDAHCIDEQLEVVCEAGGCLAGCCYAGWLRVVQLQQVQAPRVCSSQRLQASCGLWLAAGCQHAAQSTLAVNGVVLCMLLSRLLLGNCGRLTLCLGPAAAGSQTPTPGPCGSNCGEHPSGL